MESVSMYNLFIHQGFIYINVPSIKLFHQYIEYLLVTLESAV